MMLAAFTTLRHASISLLVNSIRPSGVVKLGAPPMFSSLARISGEVPAAMMSLLSFTMMSRGVPLGA